MEAPMPTATKAPSLLVKRDAGRRLYDTTNRRYAVREQLRRWAADGIAFTVIDATTGADVTGVQLA
jgi:polyhydroxyalkanoate synthesis regulator protein